jgi:hypothetical protein
MENKKVTRWKASGLHLLISIAIAASVLAVMLEIWFPGKLFQAAGGNDLLFILVSVDVIIGPLITLAVYKQGKRGMKFDLVVIAILQLSALTYGMSIVYLARPAFIVFVKDQFQVASVVDIPPEDYARAQYPQFKQPPRGGPLWVYSDFPTDSEKRNAVTFAALAGRDMETFPEFFAPYDARRQEVLKAAWTLERMRNEEPAEAKIVDASMRDWGLKEADVRYVRLKAARAWVAVLIDAKTAEPLKMVITERI